jgi:hypothetical protein
MRLAIKVESGIKVIAAGHVGAALAWCAYSDESPNTAPIVYGLT